MEEIWKDIVGYENYEVSNLGQVKSLNYNGTGKEQILKPCRDKGGYLYVNLYKDGKRKTLKIHRLVAQVFLENPENKPCVNHLDCNRQNNCVNNLEWCTTQENILYAIKLGRLKPQENGKKCSKPLIAINLITKEETYFDSQHEAARQLNISQGKINEVLKGKYKQMKGYTFRYAD